MKEKLLKRQQEILDLAKAEKRQMTDAEKAEFDVLQRLFDDFEEDGDDSEGSGVSDDSSDEEDGRLSRAIAAERTRVAEISSLCREFNIGAKDEGEFIKNGISVDDVRATILEKLKREKAPVNARCTVISDSGDKFIRAASDAMLMRSGVEIEKPAEGAEELRGMSIRDMAIECLALEGETGLSRMSSDELYTELQRQFYNPTAAFPAMLDQTINKAYVEGHKTVNVTFDRWTKKGSLKDFKIHDNYYVSGPAGEFLEVPEGGELKHDTFDDKKRPTRQLKTYGRQFSLTRHAFINDDIELVTRMPAKYAASARKTINKQVYEILLNNPVIYDGTALFNSVHGNVLTTGTGITMDAIQSMILALQTQKDEFGNPIIIRPKTLVVPVGYEFEMYTLFNSLTTNTTDNTQAVNPLYNYRNEIEIVADPTINALCGGFGQVMPWFLIGDRSDTDFIEVDYLNGQEVPNIRRMETPGTLGFVWDIFLDWGISVMDYRGAIKNNGVKINSPLS